MLSRRQYRVTPSMRSFAVLVTREPETRLPIFYWSIMRKPWYWIIPIMVFVLSLCDLGATLYFNSITDDFVEANPLAVCVWEHCGDGGLIIFKISITFASCFCMAWVLKCKKHPIWLIVSLSVLLAYCLLIGWWFFWFFSGTPA
jgi:hypothetical protein